MKTEVEGRRDPEKVSFQEYTEPNGRLWIVTGHAVWG